MAQPVRKFRLSVWALAALAVFCAHAEAAAGGDAAGLPKEVWDKARGAGLRADEVISVRELKASRDSGRPLVLFDARNKNSYDTGHIPGAVLPLPEDYFEQQNLYRDRIIAKPPDTQEALERAVKPLARDTPVVTYCGSGCQASITLLYKLKRLGFTDVRAMVEGFQAWQDAGYPVESAKS